MNVEVDVANPALLSTVVGLLNKGFGETLRDAFSTATVTDVAEDGTKTKRDKDDVTALERHAATSARLEKLEKGTYVFGSRGAAMSDEDHAMKETLKALEVKFPKGTTVAMAVEQYAVEYATEAGVEVNDDNREGIIEQVRQALTEMDVYTKTLEARRAKTAPKVGLNLKLG